MMLSIKDIFLIVLFMALYTHEVITALEDPDGKDFYENLR